MVMQSFRTFLLTSFQFFNGKNWVILFQKGFSSLPFVFHFFYMFLLLPTACMNKTRQWYRFNLSSLFNQFALSFTDELELLGGPGYEMAKRNLDMMDSLMQEVQEFYDNWTKRLDEITEKHDEEQRLQSKLTK